jgi:histidinol-phosphate aminotransferase
MTTILDSQGGDLRALPGGDYLDLSTCVNRYGPPPSVREALRSVRAAQLAAHPYGMDELFAETYAKFMAAEPEHLLVGRGITEFIRILADLLPSQGTAVITPDYTDTIRQFPVHLPPAPGTTDSAAARLDRVAAAMGAYPYVMLSNPNNPLGLHVPGQDLAEVCRSHPDSVLIVDEAYIEFLTDHAGSSMVSCGLENVVVLRSPNKLFGIAGTRTGALWTRNAGLAGAVAARKINWCLSYLDVVAATAALADVAWADRTRAALLEDTRDLERLLAADFPDIVSGVPVHYRFLPSADPVAAHRFFLDRGVAVRALDGGQPGRVAGVRVTTPTTAELAGIKERFASRLEAGSCRIPR